MGGTIETAKMEFDNVFGVFSMTLKKDKYKVLLKEYDIRIHDALS